MASPVRRVLHENFAFLYPYGNTASKNLLSCLGDVNGRKLKVLLLGCGDLRNVFQTLKEEPCLNDPDFHLNDVSPTILAHNILICYIITCGKFDFRKNEALQFLWEVWYDTAWTERTARIFLRCVLELLQGVKIMGVTISREDEGKIHWVLQQWIVSIFSVDCEKIHQERRQFICEMTTTRYLLNNRNQKESDPFSFKEAVDSAVTHLVSQQLLCVQDSMERDLIQGKFKQEFRRYFETGNSFGDGSRTGNQLVCINPTFLDPVTKAWWVHDSLSPFHSYAPLNAYAEGPGKSTAEICQGKLKDLVMTFQAWATSGRVSLNFHLGDAVELCLYRLKGEFYDVIDCSNLADHVGLANLVPFAAARLGSNGRMVTETMTWARVSGSIKEYLNVCLCAPVSMYPTLFGVRLLNNVVLGCASKSADPSFRLIAPSVSLIWARAPEMSHPPPRVNFPSCGISQWISSMVERCMALEHREGRCIELAAYTPYTLALILSALEQRIQIPNPSLLKFLSGSVKVIPDQFRLTWTAASSWLSGEYVVKYSANLRTRRSLLKSQVRGTPGLRLLLFNELSLNMVYMILKKVSCLGFNVEVIDNLDCVFQADDPDRAVVSFLAHKDLDLDQYQAAMIVTEFLPFTEAFTTDCFKRENFGLSRPQSFSGCRIAQTDPVENAMTVVGSLEDSSVYEISLKINGKGNPSGVKLDFDLTRPCEAAHQATVSVSSPKGIPLFQIAFGWPVLADSSSAKLHRSERKIILRFPKALYEPWPSDFAAALNARNLIDPDALALWTDPGDISIHLSSQFTCEQLKEQQRRPYPSWEGNPLLQLKESIKILFFRPMKEGFVLFGVKATATSSADMYILVHLPVKRTAEGTPFLLITVLDHRLAEKFVDEGLLDRMKSVRDFAEIFRNDNAAKGVVNLLCGEAELRLLRFMIRSNSLKMQPSKWQKKKVPLGPNSPWLASFVSPLYTEHPGNVQSLSESLKSSVKKETCAFCQQTGANLKRCAKCRSVLYCSAACQKAHWRLHKIKCSA